MISDDQFPRRIIFEHQRRLHQAGVSHGDFARRNFVKGAGGIRMIDFDKAELHECPESRPTGPGHELPTHCPELRKLRKSLRLDSSVSTSDSSAFQVWEGAQ
ncbi:hypothetical protein SISNIDRAFT_350914 [Sistotremastrum niveocremeum HHB9708]|uniref:Non-specific serine/threonine protein kinase n=1 Tax=Sistotremastrum niveocremeum HHB9708 TaxID=1314777 RepID=A0A164WZJ1_9AGAM|nr:hypothetical protein SISNIDRAFT_350914 [Sistotremastrum niveocremeum HHB9708]